MKTVQVLVTGFLPFLGEKLNPSQILLTSIQNEFPEGTGVDVLALPVSFNQAFAILGERLLQKRYDVVLMLGQAGGRAEICFERVALNWIETEHPDEDGYQPERGSIMPSEAEALFTSLPIGQWVESLRSLGVPAKISLSAGGYVCNDLYYKTQLLIQRQAWTTQACSIHVPYIPSQVENKPGVASMELSVMEQSLFEILRKII